MSINWNNIRAIDGQREGFEELVCQLAGQEKIETQTEFTRIGKPDGGKECFWELENGDIYGWQAKYFINSLSNSQWSQVNDSVKTTIDNHPKLTKYYIAIPVDRPDGKGRGKSMLQKWNDYVASWKEYALSKKMNVSFIYWGKHELEIRLRKPENEGLIYYFFNESELIDSWFETKNQESIDALGGRYTPELNFDLPFLEFHNGFTRDQKFSDQINYHYEKVLERYRRTYLQNLETKLESKFYSTDNAIKSFRKAYEQIKFSGVQKIPFDLIRNQLSIINESIDAISNSFYQWRREKEKTDKNERKSIEYYSRPYNNELYKLRELSYAISDFLAFLNSEICALANSPYLLLIGPAGIGKSHTLADIVSKRSEANLTSLLLLGENFSTHEMPWTQILRNQLRFNNNEDVFLTALNAKAESQQNRIIIIVDALNEGNGRRIWTKRLKSFIRFFNRFPWLGLIVSIRDSYENLIAPSRDIDNSIVSRIYHSGFEGLEYEASIHFFNHFNIIPPGSPLLYPEFQNPLFLKLFCDGLYKRGLTQVPDGYHGISTIIENYLQGVEHKLSQPDDLDYDIRLKLLRKAINGILMKMVDNQQDHLSYEIAEEIVSNIFLNKCGNGDRQYLKRLISEGVINEDLYWKDENYYDGIHFAYQRFQDHLTTSYLLDKFLNLENPQESFTQKPFIEFLKTESEARYNQNLIEALSIQVPERTGRELHEIVPHIANFYSTKVAFIEGLVWRRLDTINENSQKYINEVLIHDSELFYHFLDVSISMGTKEKFYFNADTLHEFLLHHTLAERDHFWTTWLQNKYGENSGRNSIKRLIDWAWSDFPKEQVNDESTRLAGTMLAWFLTSSNRYLRDASTKALVCLLQDRISVLIDILKQFKDVNDPYISERLYAVAYGCALRTNDTKTLIILSDYIYKTIFDEELVYPHILLRDYARGVIEYTVYLKLKTHYDLKKVRPPYKSDFPNQLPSNDEIDSKHKPKGENGHYGEKEWGSTAIFSSMTTEYGRGGGYGDFGRYVFQSALKNWDVDYDGLSNYAIQRIFEMGYDPKLFSNFDSEQGSGRGSGHLERIGKKYQWIAFYEILANVSDNCMMHGEKTFSHRGFEIESGKYDGPWHPYVRDIDPTIIIKKTFGTNYLEKTGDSPWWIPFEYNNWEEADENWKKRTDNLPSPLELLLVKDSKKIEWFNLTMLPDWKQPKKIGDDKWSYDGKRITYDIGSWLVTSKELNKMKKLYATDSISTNWFPTISNRYQVFSQEYNWSPASNFFQVNRYHGGDILPANLESPKSKKEIALAHYTTINFLWEEEFDCSKDETISYFTPSILLAIGLKSTQREGEYMNEKNEIVCFDPSVYEKGPSCLLIRKDYLLKTLKSVNMKLVWIIHGEKQILKSSFQQELQFDHVIRGLYYIDEKGSINGKMYNIIRDYNK